MALMRFGPSRGVLVLTIPVADASRPSRIPAGGRREGLSSSEAAERLADRESVTTSQEANP